METIQGIWGDGALLVFSLAGLVATSIAIMRDTRAHRAALEVVETER